MSEGLNCCLCSQILGDPSNDLIAEILGYATYKRTVLAESDRFVVFPSLGAIALGHVLLCPKEHTPSIANMTDSDLRELDVMSSRLANVLSEVLDIPVHRFEHGMARGSKRIICSVGHAHLHLLPSSVISSHFLLESSWSEVRGGIVGLADITRDSEYLLYVEPNGRTWVQLGVEGSFESQALRKVFATAHGITTAWDWKKHPRPGLVMETIELLDRVAGRIDGSNAYGRVLIRS